MPYYVVTGACGFIGANLVKALNERGITESKPAFVEEAMRHSVDFRRTQQDFIARGLAAAAKAREQGGYVSAAVVIGKLSRRIAKAKKRIGAE